MEVLLSCFWGALLFFWLFLRQPFVPSFWIAWPFHLLLLFPCDFCLIIIIIDLLRLDYQIISIYSSTLDRNLYWIYLNLWPKLSSRKCKNSRRNLKPAKNTILSSSRRSSRNTTRHWNNTTISTKLTSKDLNLFTSRCRWLKMVNSNFHSRICSWGNKIGFLDKSWIKSRIF